MDFTRLIPYIAAALLVVVAFVWWQRHEAVVGERAVAVDRAAANEVLLEAKDREIKDKQRIIDYADELSKQRYAELQSARALATRQQSELQALKSNPEIARILAIALPEPLRRVRRTGAEGGAGDGVRVLPAPGMAAADAGTAVQRPDGRGPDRGSAPAPRGVEVLQRGQGQGAQVDRKPETSTGRTWWNPLTWFEPRSNP